MRKLVVAFVLLLVATGCCKPVVVPQAPPAVVVEPELRVSALQADATWIDVSTAYKLDLAEWVAYARQLEVLLWGKTSPAPKPPEN